MLERPDEPALLEALAKFLLADLHPAVKDKKLAFRVLIAANIAGTLATQLRTQDERRAAELSRLRALLGGPERSLRELNAALVEKLRSGGLAAEELEKISAHVKQTLQEALSVVNPSFDTSVEIE
ncbi:MAG TPA: DUF6285 domain-containing protein [Myxococcales bacterium]|nr:DUF6285 domain-containing protein [Myxococcales bacterium]